MDGIFRVSIDRCIACGKCELACAFSHGRNGQPGAARIHVLRRGPERGIPLTCLQCHDAACVAKNSSDAPKKISATKGATNGANHGKCSGSGLSKKNSAG